MFSFLKAFLIKGYGERERERENLSKVVFFLAKMNAPVRGMERERKSFKSGVFFGKN